MTVAPSIDFSVQSFYSSMPGFSYSDCQHVWSYGGKLVLLTKNFFNAIGRSFLVSEELSFLLKQTASHLRCFSIVGVPFSLVETHSLFLKILKNLYLGDVENAMLGTLSLSTVTADTLDSVITFVNGALNLIASQSIEAFSSMALPLGFFVMGTGTISRTLQVAKNAKIYGEMDPDSFSASAEADREVWRKEFEEKLKQNTEIDSMKRFFAHLQKKDPSALAKAEEIKERKKESILNSVPKEAQKAVERILARIDEGKGAFNFKEIEEARCDLQEIRSQLREKIQIDVFGIMANCLTIVGLSLFAVGIADMWPFILMGVAFAIRIAVLAYQDRQLICSCARKMIHR